MELVQVRMLDEGPNKNYKKGAIVTVDAARAAHLVEVGSASRTLTTPAPKRKSTEEVKTKWPSMS